MSSDHPDVEINGGNEDPSRKKDSGLTDIRWSCKDEGTQKKMYTKFLETKTHSTDKIQKFCIVTMLTPHLLSLQQPQGIK